MYFLGLGEQPLFPMAYNLDFPICKVPSLFVIFLSGKFGFGGGWYAVRAGTLAAPLALFAQNDHML